VSSVSASAKWLTRLAHAYEISPSLPTFFLQLYEMMTTQHQNARMAAALPHCRIAGALVVQLCLAWAGNLLHFLQLDFSQ
jgi:hypothetical protein